MKKNLGLGLTLSVGAALAVGRALHKNASPEREAEEESVVHKVEDLIGGEINASTTVSTNLLELR